MLDQEIMDAYFMMKGVWALLYENFDAEPRWRPVVIQEVRFNPTGQGIDWILLMILDEESGYPTPWRATLAQEKFTTDLRKEPDDDDRH